MSQKGEPPEDLVCPISLLLMTNDPVLAADGVTYERSSIQEWFEKSKTKQCEAKENLKRNPHSKPDQRIVEAGICSPVHGTVIPNLNLVPNISVRNMARDFVQSAYDVNVSTHAAPAQPSPSGKDVDVVASSKIDSSKRKRTEILECCNCSSFKRREKFSNNQWQRGLKHPDKNVFCRRCEEKILIRKQVGRKNEHLCLRMHTKKSRVSDLKYLCTVMPANAKKMTFLPKEMTLDGYTREEWSKPNHENSSAWQTTILKCIIGERKLSDFFAYLTQRKKSVYGTFILSNGTDGLFFVPYYQELTDGKFICKYILGLGLLEEDEDHRVKDAEANETEEDIEGDYISSSVLGSLLVAQRKTDHSLHTVPKGSVKAAQKVKGRPSRPKNTGQSKDWFGPKNMVREEAKKRRSVVFDVEHATL